MNIPELCVELSKLKHDIGQEAMKSPRFNFHPPEIAHIEAHIQYANDLIKAMSDRILAIIRAGSVRASETRKPKYFLEIEINHNDQMPASVWKEELANKFAREISRSFGVWFGRIDYHVEDRHGRTAHTLFLFENP